MDTEWVPDAILTMLPTTHTTNAIPTNTTTITNTTNPFTTTTMPLRESSRIRHPTNFFANTQEQPNNNTKENSNDSSKKRKGVPSTTHSSNDEDDDLHQDFPLPKVVKERENSSVRTNNNNRNSVKNSSNPKASSTTKDKAAEAFKQATLETKERVRFAKASLDGDLELVKRYRGREATTSLPSSQGIKTSTRC